MKFAFPVKHNGIDYEPGQEVPIGVEPVKENALNDMSVAEIRKELTEKYGVEKFPSNKKADLIALLEETKANLESTESEEEEVSEDETEEETESENEEDEDSDLLNKIANE
nr:hypothetical protein XLIUZIGB_XLIUZIGB_CDS_0064 [Caudoviricetes sp.]